MSSPASRTTSDVPPVPRLPALVTSDLPSRSSGKFPFYSRVVFSDLLFCIGLSSEITPSSEIQAMVEAQREVMDMLGITDDTLSIGSATGSLPRRRRKSLSAVETSPTSPARTRRNSEILSPVLRGPNMTDVSLNLPNGIALY